MEKRRIIVTITLMAMMFMIILSGCGKTKLSGTYVNELNSAEYLEFVGESKVSLHSEQGSLDGSYRIADDAVVASFGLEDDSIMILQIENNKVIYSGLTAFIKKGFWEKHWLKIVIGFFALGIISIIYTKITGRSLEDDIDELGDRIGD